MLGSYAFVVCGNNPGSPLEHSFFWESQGRKIKEWLQIIFFNGSHAFWGNVAHTLCSKQGFLAWTCKHSVTQDRNPEKALVFSEISQPKTRVPQHLTNSRRAVSAIALTSSAAVRLSSKQCVMNSSGSYYARLPSMLHGKWGYFPSKQLVMNSSGSCLPCYAV